MKILATLFLNVLVAQFFIFRYHFFRYNLHAFFHLKIMNLKVVQMMGLIPWKHFSIINCTALPWKNFQRTWLTAKWLREQTNIYQLKYVDKQEDSKFLLIFHILRLKKGFTHTSAAKSSYFTWMSHTNMSFIWMYLVLRMAAITVNSFTSNPSCGGASVIINWKSNRNIVT